MKLDFKHTGSGYLYSSSNPDKLINIDNLNIYLIKRSNMFTKTNGSITIFIESNICEDFNKDEYYNIEFVSDKIALDGTYFGLLFNNLAFKEKQKNILGDVFLEFLGDFDNSFEVEFLEVGELK